MKIKGNIISKKLIKNYLIGLSIIFVLIQPIQANQGPVVNAIPGQEYYTDDSGNVYMYINVIGHVKSPGTYLIYEGDDILTILYQAGGPLPGAKLKETIIYRKNSELIKVTYCTFTDLSKKETHNMEIEIIGKSGIDIVNTLIKEKLISSLQHAADMGIELTKAEIALKYNLEYIQDKDLEL